MIFVIELKLNVERKDDLAQLFLELLCTLLFDLNWIHF